MKYPRIYFRLIIFISVLIWCAAFSSNIITNGSDASLAATPFFNFFFDNVCHQDKAKTISLNGFDFLVCSRCSGIYFGALLVSFLILFIKTKKEIKFNLFMTASVVLLTDVVLNNFVFNPYNKLSAFLTGLFLGSVSLLIVSGILEEDLMSMPKQ